MDNREEMYKLNCAIKALEERINRNEIAQDYFISKNGFENVELYKKHDQLCDEMEKLCDLRRSL